MERDREQPWLTRSYDMDEWMEWDMYNCVFLLCYAAKDPATLDERRSGPTVISFVGLNGRVYGKPCTDHMECRDDLEQMAGRKEDFSCPGDGAA